jgi:type VI secretion system protein VasD
LAGCGLVQSVSDATANGARAVFYKQVKTLHLDFSARAALNTHTVDMSALSTTTLVRVYQLRDSKSFAQATYERLLNQGADALGPDLLDERAVVIKPGEGAQLSVPMQPDARYVAVVALFRQPDLQENAWRLILSRDELDPELARVVELADNRLLLRTPVEE